jgi:carbamoyltransferase
MLKMARSAQRETGSRRLCLAGGVALNCVGNGRILREGRFDDMWIQPAAGDAGGALGVAYAIWHRYLGKPRTSAEASGAWKPRSSTAASGRAPAYADAMSGALLGPKFSNDEIGSWLTANSVGADRLDGDALPRRVAELIAQGKVIGLFQGRMEFGPRALGGRSIIGDARSPAMQSVLNLKIKFRESFRPFAPAVLREHVAEWFDIDYESPYMLLVADVAATRLVPLPPEADALWGIEKLKVPRSTIPAVTHVDNSARVQTVRRPDNPLYYDIIRAFYELTGCPVIVNTSFNVKDEPIVCTPEDAYRCFMKTEMDVLVMESYVVTKAAGSPAPGQPTLTAIGSAA